MRVAAGCQCCAEVVQPACARMAQHLGVPVANDIGVPVGLGGHGAAAAGPIEDEADVAGWGTSAGAAGDGGSAAGGWRRCFWRALHCKMAMLTKWGGTSPSGLGAGAPGGGCLFTAVPSSVLHAIETAAACVHSCPHLHKPSATGQLWLERLGCSGRRFSGLPPVRQQQRRLQAAMRVVGRRCAICGPPPAPARRLLQAANGSSTRHIWLPLHRAPPFPGPQTSRGYRGMQCCAGCKQGKENGWVYWGLAGGRGSLFLGGGTGELWGML